MINELKTLNQFHSIYVLFMIQTTATMTFASFIRKRTSYTNNVIIKLTDIEKISIFVDI